VEGPIIVGTDGSKTAAIAVREAVRLAAAFGLPLHIVSAFRPETVSMDGVPAEFAGTVTTLSDVESLLLGEATIARAAGIEVETHAMDGDPADILLTLAEQLDAGLIVIGDKGIGSLKRFVLGNVPSKVVHNSPCSTLVVHTG